jgi:hypothetical protein
MMRDADETIINEDMMLVTSLLNVRMGVRKPAEKKQLPRISITLSNKRVDKDG